MAPKNLYAIASNMSFNKEKSHESDSYDLFGDYGKDALSDRVCQQWFVKFRNNNFDLEDEQRSGKQRQLT